MKRIQLWWGRAREIKRSLRMAELVMFIMISLQIFEGLERLRELVLELDTRFRYAVEVRYSSWYKFNVNN